MVNVDSYLDTMQSATECSFKDYLFDSFCETHGAKYGGSFLTKTGDAIFIKRVIYEKPKVIIIWNDGTKSVASCATIDENNYNFESGLNIAINNRLYGYDEMRRLYEDWLPENYSDDVDPDAGYIVDIKDVRRVHKARAKVEWAEDKRRFEEELVASLQAQGLNIVLGY